MTERKPSPEEDLGCFCLSVWINESLSLGLFLERLDELCCKTWLRFNVGSSRAVSTSGVSRVQLGRSAESNSGVRQSPTRVFSSVQLGRSVESNSGVHRVHLGSSAESTQLSAESNSGFQQSPTQAFSRVQLGRSVESNLGSSVESNSGVQ
ncbi:hypothetical protein WMY93_033892 [Mugilogobius chulae]|uniref:Uncharacterized protein n=1 Tax=Mugilogobius chulae TaxID=88201 RepID=A0AAW0MG02_9GOBI